MADKDGDRPGTPKPRSPQAFKLEAAKSAQPSAGKVRRQAKTATKKRQPKAIKAEVAMVSVPDEAAQRLDPALVATIDQDLTPPVAEYRSKTFSWTKLFIAALASLAALATGLAVDQLIRDLFTRHEWLGWLGAGVTTLLVLAAFAIIIRELWALSRLSKIDAWRNRAQEAFAANDVKSAKGLITDLTSLYANRPDTARGRAALEPLEGEIIDGSDLLRLFERDLMTPLDLVARKMVLDSARRVSVVTAVSPRAIVDIAFVLMENTRLTRRLSQHYGGRPGFLGFWRLFTNVIAHLAVTGSIALGDSLIQQVVGHGLAARLSSKLGEGVVNGILTARIGIAAIDVCRPLPFLTTQRPGIGDFLSDLLPLAPRPAKNGQTPE